MSISTTTVMNNETNPLREAFETETGITWINSQGEPDIDYVDWLERKVQSQSLPAVEQPVLSNKIGHINCDSEALKDPEFVNAINQMAELAYYKTAPSQPEGKTLEKVKYRLGRKLNRVILTQDGTKEIAVVTFMPGCKELAEKVVKILNNEP